MDVTAPAGTTRALVAHAAVVQAAARLIRESRHLEPHVLEELAGIIEERTAIMADLAGLPHLARG